MADKPSRALILYGDGLIRSLAAAPSLSHLHSFASRASTGFLALPHSPPSENEEARVVREFAELLDSSQLCNNLDAQGSLEDKNETTCGFITISERFMGMKTALITDNLSLKSFATKLGVTVLRWNDDVPLLASKLLKLLGFQEGKIVDSSEFDLVIVHVGAGDKLNDLKDIEFLNLMVGNLLRLEQSNADISSRLHTSVIMSYGAVLDGDQIQFSVSGDKHESNSELSLPFPRQSYTMKAGKPRENVRHHCPMLFAQYQKAVTRRDMVESFCFRDFIENSGNLVIPADRLLHEVAFKLWKAPKYGA